MATSYKTPGVYVEEIPKLPSAVTPVETAVPAFIGYTAMAEKNGEILTNKPTKISSVPEFEAYFGSAPDTRFSVYLDTNDVVTDVALDQMYYMYDSIRMFYANGGGNCFIVSVGKYGRRGVAKADLMKGLKALEKEDEPTLIACPDATLMTGSSDLYDFQQTALIQCNKLGDRFLICDLKKINEKVANETLQDRVEDFRKKIGSDCLKYGAAYVPYIHSSLSKTIRFRSVVFFRGTPGSSSPVAPQSLTGNKKIVQLIYDLRNSKKAADDIAKIVSTTRPQGILTRPSTTLEDQYKRLFDAYQGTDTQKLSAIKAIYSFTQKILAAIKDFQGTLPVVVADIPDPPSKASSQLFILKADITSLVTTTGVKDAFDRLVKHSNAALAASGQAGQLLIDDPSDKATNLNKALTLIGLDAAAYAANVTAGISTLYAAPATLAVRNEEAKKAVAGAYPAVLAYFYAVKNAAESYDKNLNDGLISSFNTYKNILTKIEAASSQMPPSGAVCGVYATTDSTRGVWKAPANTSLSAVTAPVIAIDNATQDYLTIDVNAGKSINVIRAFTGKGTVIWGARTLAGNDNEWRYIPVRRLFNMVEESSKKAVEAFVFEPNDANTWVKVQGMLENFLTTLWRRGALQGAKPEHAFYVAVSLGKTMTALDILQGRMIVEIGMAVVRPAEFINLRFMQKMAER